jgi:NADH-quinone oxidoreductase subunit M
MQIVAHGLSTGGLFIVAGFVSERIGSRDITEMGGLWGVAPRLGGMTMVLGLASLGLPGLANFVAEFLILAGAFGEHPIIASVATLGLIAATIYALWLVQATFHGENRRGLSCADLDVREMGVMVALLIALVWLGLYPSPLLDLARSAVQSLRDSAGMLAMGG